MQRMKDLLAAILEEMGFIIFDIDNEDFAISDYITDSIQFLNFIISIEQLLGIELTDDFLKVDILSSANGLANKLLVFCEINNIDPQNLKVTVN